MKKVYVVFLIVFFGCSKEAYRNCFSVCDPSKSPDLQIVINAEEEVLYPDGTVDSNSYFFKRYGVRTQPIRFTPNQVVTPYLASYYDWPEGDTIHLVRLQCLVENIASFDTTCQKDWEFNESQGTIQPNGEVFFEGLFRFETYEKGKGNNWKLLTTDYKKRFDPRSQPTQEFVYNTNFCYYYGIGERAIQAQMGDFYFNGFRFPNHDGIYRLIIEFNPLIKNCRAVKETNYNNNKKTFIVQITEGQVIFSLLKT